VRPYLGCYAGRVIANASGYLIGATYIDLAAGNVNEVVVLTREVSLAPVPE